MNFLHMNWILLLEFDNFRTAGSDTSFNSIEDTFIIMYCEEQMMLNIICFAVFSIESQVVYIIHTESMLCLANMYLPLKVHKQYRLFIL